MPAVDGVPVLVSPPGGYAADLAHPQRNLVPEIYYVSGAGLVVSTAFLAQRIYTKAFVARKLQAEDYLLLSAWVISLTILIIFLHAVSSGAGLVHIWEMSLDKYSEYKLYSYVTFIFFNIPGSLAKLSLLVFYLRLSPQPFFIWSVRATFVCIVAYTVGLLFATVFSCTPIRKAWDIDVLDGHCTDPAARFIATATLNIVSDIVILCLPLPVVLRLQISKVQKLGLFVVFALASATLVTSIVRLVYIVPILKSSDPTWDIGPVSLWGMAEANLLVICATLPTIPMFIHHVVPRAWQERFRRHEPRQYMPPRGTLVTIGGSGGKRASRLPSARSDKYAMLAPEDELYGSPGWAVSSLRSVACLGQKEGYDSDLSGSTVPEDGNTLQAKTRTNG